jgi:hypothetical protein
MRTNTVRFAWFALLLASGTAAGAGIDWHHWEMSAFETAKSKNRIILVNVGMEGCAACARMEAQTYADRRVIELINEHFVAIEVDAEARPDIGERYSDWAWPATIFLAPDSTQVLAVRGNRLPRNFIPILNSLIEKHVTGTLEPDPRSPYAAPPQPQDTDLTLIRDNLRSQVDVVFISDPSLTDQAKTCVLRCLTSEGDSYIVMETVPNFTSTIRRESGEFGIAIVTRV